MATPQEHCFRSTDGLQCGRLYVAFIVTELKKVKKTVGNNWVGVPFRSAGVDLFSLQIKLKGKEKLKVKQNRNLFKGQFH